MSASAPSRELTTEDVWFSSGEDRCRGWLVRPAELQGPLPVVVLSHGLGATHALHYWRSAETFARAGYAALDFDPRRLGESEGEPRQTLPVRDGIEDVRAAIAYVRSRDDLGPVVLFGSSIGGGFAAEVAADDPDLAALLLVVPHVDGLTNLPGLPVRDRLRMLRAAAADRRARRRGGVRTLRLFARPGDPEAAIDRDGAGEVVREEVAPGGRWDGDRYEGPSGAFVNRLAASDVLATGLFRPGRRLREVRCPTFAVIGTQDTVTPPGPQRKALRAAGAEVVELPFDHFGPFRAQHFGETASHLTGFLDRTLR